jgi:acyl-coenzyme A thioesterase PaaI-like protein
MRMSVIREHAVISTSSNGHVNCLVCGTRNPWSLGLSFHVGDADTVWARFEAHPGLQGYDGILHGGVICGLLDAAMTHCLFHNGIQAVTADLRVRFLKPVPCEALLDVKAWPISMRSPLYCVAAELLHKDEVMASAEGKFMQCPR